MRTSKEVLKDIAAVKKDLANCKANLAQRINGQTELFKDTEKHMQLTAFEIKIDSSRENIKSILAGYENTLTRLKIELNLILNQSPVPLQPSLFKQD